MRICLKHREKATATLENKRTGEEFDLCLTCEADLVEILKEKPISEVNDGRKRVPGRPKSAKK